MPKQIDLRHLVLVLLMPFAVDFRASFQGDASTLMGAAIAYLPPLDDSSGTLLVGGPGSGRGEDGSRGAFATLSLDALTNGIEQYCHWGIGGTTEGFGSELCTIPSQVPLYLGRVLVASHSGGQPGRGAVRCITLSNQQIAWTISPPDEGGVFPGQMRWMSGKADGSGDLVAVAGLSAYPGSYIERIHFIDLESGAIRRSISVEQDSHRFYDFHLIPDTDGDKVSDIVLAGSFEGSRRGSVEILSGVDGSPLSKIEWSDRSVTRFRDITVGELDASSGLSILVPCGRTDNGDFIVSVRAYSLETGRLLFELDGADRSFGNSMAIIPGSGRGAGSLAIGSPWAGEWRNGLLQCFGATGELLWERFGKDYSGRFGGALCVIDDIDRDGTKDLAVGQAGLLRGETKPYVHIVSGKSGAILYSLAEDDLGF
jgi:hypothetical protein